MTAPAALSVVNPLTIQVGPGRLIMSQAPAGLQLVNNDLNNAVWISDNPSVAPGTGWRIGSNGGSCTWQLDGEAIYGCVDTGVTQAVTITAGNSVTNLQDPEAVALATVTGLVTQGIPTVLVGSAIQGASLNGGQFDVSQYATVFIGLQAGAPQLVAVPPPFGTAEPCAIRIRQGSIGPVFVGLGGAWFYDKTYSLNTLLVPPSHLFQPAEGQLLLAIPVRGPQMQIDGIQPGGAATTVSGFTAYGTNRLVNDDMVLNSDGICVMTKTGYTASIQNRLTNFANSAHDYLLSKGGPAQIAISSSASAGSLYVQQLTAAGGTVNTLLANFAASTSPQYFEVFLAAGMLALSFVPAATSAGTVQVDIQQGL